MALKLPYLDMILSRLECEDREFEEAFWRHTHFGYWPDPESAYDDRDDSIAAMERMCQHLIGLAEIQTGQDVLDVGCGFGGALASLDERFTPLRMTGLNIDDRQLRVARQRVNASAGNRIDFVLGDACAMTFPEASFDRVLAIECIFHFPDRAAFFQRAGRSLRPGGNLTLTDFLQPEGTPNGLWDSEHPLWGTQTAIDIPAYQQLAASSGLVLTHARDISANVRPSYHWFGRVLEKHFPGSEKAALESRFVVDVGGLGYCALRFDRPFTP